MPNPFKYLVLVIACIFFIGLHSTLMAKDGETVSAEIKESASTPAESEKSPPDTEKAEINWYSYEDGIERIKEENKKGYLNFYTDWCAYCKLMNRQTFADADVASYMNANFIPIRINAEEEKQVAEKYGVYRFPANWFLAEDAENIANYPGFIPPDMMIRVLEYISSDSYQSLQFQEYLDKQEQQTAR